MVLDELADSFSSDFSVEHEYEMKELVETVNRFLYTISDTDRNIFVTRYWLFTPVAEIATRSGFSQSKVLTSLYRTRQKLQYYITKEGLL